MKKLREIEEVGWIFFVVVFILLIPLGVLVSWAVTDEVLASKLVRGGIAVFTAAFSSGLVSWIVNEILYRLKKRRDLERQKSLKKEKKKKKRR